MTASLCLTTSCAGETRALGQALARLLRSGDVVLLTGDMGAGKSEFARGMARGLGIGGNIPSPSFAILHLYEEGVMPFKHFDWYRIQHPEELAEAGLDEQVGGDGVTAIEWHQRAPFLVPTKHLEICLTPLGEASRQIAFLPRGGFRELDWQSLSEGKP